MPVREGMNYAFKKMTAKTGNILIFLECIIFESLMKLEVFHSIQLLGIVLMVLGALIFIAPLLLEKLPELEKIPWIILYVYRGNKFIFATSPILIIVSLVSLLLWLLSRLGKL